MGASHRAVTKVNPEVASKTANPKVEPSVYGRRQHGSSQLTDAAGRFGGVLGTARGQGHAEQLEKRSSPRREIGGAGKPYSAVKLVDDLAGESPVSANYPVGTVVISGGGAAVQTAESPEVNALVGWMEIRSAPTGGLATQQVVAQANRSEASKIPASPESECEDVRERRNCYMELKASVSGEVLGICSRRVPRGLGGRHVAKEHQ